jgi:hypothetical protein
MLHYRDKTFCPFYETCSKQSDCSRPLTPQVKADAVKWWGGDNAPIAMFGEKPECHTDNVKSTHGEKGGSDE